CSRSGRSRLALAERLADLGALALDDLPLQLAHVEDAALSLLQEVLRGVRDLLLRRVALACPARNDLRATQVVRRSPRLAGREGCGLEGETLRRPRRRPARDERGHRRQREQGQHGDPAPPDKPRKRPRHLCPPLETLTPL